MAFKKRHAEKLVAADPTTVGTVGLGASYGRVFGIVARNFSSSAKSAGGTSTTQKLKLTDANSDVFYLDATARDMTTEVTLMLGYDDVNTGGGILPVTGTGAAYVAGEGQALGPPVVKSPVTITVLEGEVATDYISVDLLVEV